ncbi:PH domain-containing protein [Nocardioides stalactiti]|uniref:PH domain-containing protein n=1 Tax=Nocardioides stalactiti TaxID=2755356 RepID=UPI0015FEF6BF|nr:PH domain-containing protein [Nocardioides stalactiti]
MNEPWLRLDPRMLLVHPLREVVKFLPVLIGMVVAGGASGAGPWGVVGIGVPVVIGLVRYLTTSYRISESRVELRRGLVQRHTLSSGLDRVRSVDVTATVAHRALGLATLVIGTGSVATDGDEQLELDGLPREQADALRSRLLRLSTAPAGTTEPGAAPAAVPIARFSARWLWYAPFTSAGLVALGALVGVVGQTSEMVDLDLRISEDDLEAVTGLLLLGAVAAVAVLVVVVTVVGYLVVNGGFTLVREGGAWHVRRGLLTTRDTSIDETRVAGVSRGEPAGLRLARGARLSVIATGLARSGDASTILVPPAAQAVVAGAAEAVLGSPAPMSAALRPHGRAAVRRRYTRALLGALPFAAAPVVLVAVGGPAWLLLGAALAAGVALALARDRARALGHTLVDGFIVTRSGSLLRRRDALGTEHVIGWTFRDTWFQRRIGLTDVAATTAGGSGQVGVPDVPAEAAITWAGSATPGLVDPFLTSSARV